MNSLVLKLLFFIKFVLKCCCCCFAILNFFLFPIFFINVKIKIKQDLMRRLRHAYVIHINSVIFELCKLRSSISKSRKQKQETDFERILPIIFELWARFLCMHMNENCFISCPLSSSCFQPKEYFFFFFGLEKYVGGM